MSKPSFAVAERLKDQSADSVWVVMSRLALENKPVANLAQGFANYGVPKHVLDALAKTAQTDEVMIHQYGRGSGHRRLVDIIAKLYGKLIGRTINPDNEVLIGVGAAGVLYCAFMAFLNPGDEVILIEPFFDSYEPMILMAGAKPVYVPLRLQSTQTDRYNCNDWVLDHDKLAAKFNSNTKMIVINTPHNPTGKVFSEYELRFIGELCKKHNVIAMLDEVYEWMIFDDHKHVRMASFADMWNRTITIGSAGKSFSITGWKIGWAYGPQELIKQMQFFHQKTLYACATPLQEAIAVGLEKEYQLLNTPASFWKQLSSELQIKRDRLAQSLAAAGLKPTVPQGGYFMMADFADFVDKIDLGSNKDETQDLRFAKWLSAKKKLHGLPPSAFYSPDHKHLAKNLIRFCFIKNEETIVAAEKAIADLAKL